MNSYSPPVWFALEQLQFNRFVKENDNKTYLMRYFFFIIIKVVKVMFTQCMKHHLLVKVKW